MKVLCVSAFLPHEDADSAGVLDVFHMLRFLGARHEVTLVCPVADGEVACLAGAQRVAARVVAMPDQTMQDRRRYVGRTALSFFTGLPAIAYVADRAGLRGALVNVLGDERFDVAHFAFTQTMHLRDALPAALPAVVDEPDIAFERRQRYARLMRNPLARLGALWDGRKLERYELRWLARFDGVLVRTEREERLLRAAAGLRTTLVFPPWVDLSFRDAVNPTPTGRDVLFFSALWRPVNDDAARWMAGEILPLVRRRVPDARLFIVGSRPSAAVRRLASDAVVVTGFVDSPAEYYDRCAVAVAPLRAGSGAKVKVLQALAVGRPVVTTPIGAEGIPATEADGLFVRATAGEFAGAVVELLTSARERGWHAAGRRFFDAHHAWDAACAAWEEMLRSIAQAPPGR